VDFNVNHLANGSITFPYVGVATETIPGPGIGLYEVTLRYSNGSTSIQTINLSANGGVALPLILLLTGSYSTWSTASTLLSLNTGNNASRYRCLPVRRLRRNWIR